jgi:maltose O-acetyltransferase
MNSRLARWKRDLWNVWWGRIPSRRIRRLLLKRMLGKYDPTQFVGLNVKFFDPWNVFVDPHAVINPDCLIDARGGSVVIGNNVDIGTQTHIWTLEHDPHDANHGTKGGDVTIEDHVWIASRVTILPGVRLGRGAVVACGAVVTRDVPEKAIVAGIPAKVIGTRDNPLEYQLNFNPRFR